MEYFQPLKKEGNNAICSNMDGPRDYLTKWSKSEGERQTPYHTNLPGLLDGAVGKASTCQCRRCKRCRFDSWVGKIPCRRKWQPVSVFLPAKFHRQRSLAGYSSWGRKESDMTKRLSTHTHMHEPIYETENVLTDIANWLFAVEGEVRWGRDGVEWEIGVSRCKLLYIEWINNKVLLYSTGNYIQYPVINSNAKEYKKEKIHTHI